MTDKTAQPELCAYPRCGKPKSHVEHWGGGLGHNFVPPISESSKQPAASTPVEITAQPATPQAFAECWAWPPWAFKEWVMKLNCEGCELGQNVVLHNEEYWHVLPNNPIVPWLPCESTRLRERATDPRSAARVTRFDEFDDADHPFRKWWEKHGQFMMSGGSRRESIWAARGWIAREQLGFDKEVTGDSMHESQSAAGVRTIDELIREHFPELWQSQWTNSPLGLETVRNQVKQKLRLFAAALAEQSKPEDLIPGIAGQSPCAGCGKGIDGAFESVMKVNGKWYHEPCALAESQREK